METAEPSAPDDHSNVIQNIKNLLSEHPNGIEIRQLSRKYFEKFECFPSIPEFGFANLADILKNGDAGPNFKFQLINGMVKLIKKTTGSRKRQRSNSSRFSTNTNGAGQMIVDEQNGSSPAVNNNNPMKRSGSESPVRRGKKRGNDEDESSVTTKSSTNTSDFSEMSHVSIAPRDKAMLDEERREIRWIPRETPALIQLDFNLLVTNRKLEAETPDYFIETDYCDKQVLEDLMDVKTDIRRVRPEMFNAQRARLNLFDTQSFGFFQHGAAIKMANIDAIMGMALTSPKRRDGDNIIKGNDLLYFVDIYGGPGGHAEYFLWKKKWLAKGFGFASEHMGYNIAQAEHFPRESFEVYSDPYENPNEKRNKTPGWYGIGRPYLLSRFVTFVRESTDMNGVHVVIANGGWNGDPIEEDVKELKCKSIVLAEILLALQLLREGGHFVIRVHDTFTPSSVALIYLLYQTFEEVAIYKPETSLPASSEKFILCKWRRPYFVVNEIANYLDHCHKMEWLAAMSYKKDSRVKKTIITHIVSTNRIKQSRGFLNYMQSTNIELAKRQLEETKGFITSVETLKVDKLVEKRRADLKEKCQTLWGLPPRVREKPKYSKATTPEIRAMKLSLPYSHDFIQKKHKDGDSELVMGNLVTELIVPKQWSFMAVGPECGFFMSLGGQNVYKYEGEGRGWNLVSDTIDLMNNTLVYADLVDEYEIHGTRQAVWKGLHIIDAMILGGKDIRALPSDERFDLITKFANSMNKISRTDICAIRSKLTYSCKLRNMQRFLSSVKKEKLRGRGGGWEDGYLTPVGQNSSKIQFGTCGVLFVKSFKASFAPGDLRFCLENRVHWSWTDKVIVNVPDKFLPGPFDYEGHGDEDEDKDNVFPVHGVTILDYLSQFM